MLAAAGRPPAGAFVAGNVVQVLKVTLQASTYIGFYFLLGKSLRRILGRN